MLRTEENNRRVWVAHRLARGEEVVRRVQSMGKAARMEVAVMRERLGVKEEEAAWASHRLEKVEEELVRVRGVKVLEPRPEPVRSEREERRREERERRQGETKRGREAREREEARKKNG